MKYKFLIKLTDCCDWKLNADQLSFTNRFELIDECCGMNFLAMFLSFSPYLADEIQEKETSPVIFW